METGQPFPDRRAELFGRAPDINALIARAHTKGLTAIVARPQMGKTWLLLELARRLCHDHHPPYIVGYAEAFGETADLLLRAVVDLYTRWLSDASYLRQARMVWQQEKASVVSQAAKAFGSILEALGKTIVVGEGVASLVREGLNALVEQNKKLQSGGIQLPSLTYEQARELLKLTTRISGRRLALVLDQWEKSPALHMEHRTLDSFLRNIAGWPDVHVFVALRPHEPDDRPGDKPAMDYAREWQRAYSGTAQIYELKPMDLGEPAEHTRLVTTLHKRVRATQVVTENELLAILDGYPGTMMRWNQAAQSLVSADDLREVASQAQQYRFRELENRLSELDDGHRRLAIRLALLPLGTAEAWEKLKGPLLAGSPEDHVADLKAGEVLEATEPPSYGHAKRGEAARAWLMENRKAAVKEELDNFVRGLASRVRGVDSSVRLFAVALLPLSPLVEEISSSPASRAICATAASLFRTHEVFEYDLILEASRIERQRDGAVAGILAMGLFNALYNAKKQNHISQRNALLEELRQLHGRFSNDFAVSEELSSGLFNTLIHAKEENDLPRRDALLGELRRLHQRLPDEALVRERLARGLFNTMNHANEENDLRRRDELLAELRELHQHFRDDGAVRRPLAMAISNRIYVAREENDLKHRDELLEELRQLHGAFPDDAAVGLALAIGLNNTLIDAKQPNEIPGRDKLLDELRQLHSRFADNGPFAEQLAKGLGSCFLDALEEQQAAVARKFWAELKELAPRLPEGLIREATLRLLEELQER